MYFGVHIKSFPVEYVSSYHAPNKNFKEIVVGVFER